MSVRSIGTILLTVGLIFAAISIFLFPPAGVPGSYTTPLTASPFFTTQSLLEEKHSFPGEFYVEVAMVSPAILSISPPLDTIVPLTYQRGIHYHHSYVYRAELTQTEYAQLAGLDEIVGIWDIPTIMLTQGSNSIYGDMDGAINSTSTDSLISRGKNGEGVIIAIIDSFPPENKFYQYFPREWADRIIHYAEDVSTGNLHGIMTASIAANVAPKAELYLIGFESGIMQGYQEVLSLKTLYPDHKIVTSNSYVFNAIVYYSEDHPVNRKVLEIADNEIIVAFGAGNWAHQGEHDPRWTFDVGYDSRNGNFDRDSEIGYPAVFNLVISVAGSNAFSDKIVSYSSLGGGVGGFDEPDVSAPTQFPYEHSPYGYSGGTSGSCPFMAGVCALVLTGNDADSSKMIGAIHSSSVDMGNSGFDDEFGYGIVNAVDLYDAYVSLFPQTDDEDILQTYMMPVGIGMIGLGIVFRRKEDIEKTIRGLQSK